MIARAPMAALCLVFAACEAPPPPADVASESAPKDEPRGLRAHLEAASPGYVMFSPLLSDTTYLIDNDGLVVHTWKSQYAPSGGLYLLENGNLLRPARQPDVAVFKGGGQGGRIEEYSWDGELLWDFLFASEEHLLHHDIEPLPNGNVLAIAWERKSAEEARRAGRREDWIPDAGLWPDLILELEPVRPDGARILWEWHMWDHKIQNVDPDAEDYGEPARHPERIDVNGDGEPREVDPEELEQLKALGYVPSDAEAEDIGSDLLHTNAVAYNPELDQIVLSVPRFNEIWVIDHSTTTEEARGSTGGRWGRGGDLLYRWGNPRSYGRGGDAERRLYEQHDAHWISEGLRGAGNIMVYNNDVAGENGNYSAVVEIAPPVDSGGRYVAHETAPFGPAEPLWTYVAADRTSFYSPFISGARRLPNGNTLVCSGAQGRFFEVTASGEIAWEYWTPYSGRVRNRDGTPPHPVAGFTYAVFRATRVAPHHPALSGRALEPLDPQPPPVTADDLAQVTTP